MTAVSGGAGGGLEEAGDPGRAGDPEWVGDSGGVGGLEEAGDPEWVGDSVEPGALRTGVIIMEEGISAHQSLIFAQHSNKSAKCKLRHCWDGIITAS